MLRMCYDCSLKTIYSEMADKGVRKYVCGIRYVCDIRYDMVGPYSVHIRCKG
jgi:hypothetical protein